ncbi:MULTISPECIES: hypothetical protein [unclassified Synechocystis]|uniref:hypothetical protein n=1 Tax=unclassified Synechocystis TaxID=2640012 RepID=UPI00048FA990|nr:MULTISPECIES: hypothetical protein [unclassified Synechocystis]AIE72556.1 hypothetical protein D082_00270 [Synechocystis sp. PCC 6714]MCT0254474.1 hypothetical protein [Synechocystis sp. CS-94]
MGFASKIFGMFDKIDDIVYAPIKLATDWASEPLKRWEHQREIEKINIDSNNKQKEKENDLNLELKKQEADTSLRIKKETEIIRIITEIEECRKDFEFKRMEAVSEAMMRLQRELTQLNVDAINMIGNIQLGLRKQAQDLVYERTLKYKELQDSAMQEAMRDLKRIEEEFGDNELSKTILINAVDKRLANIINTAHNFLLELNSDIKLLNQNIDILTSSGQQFIERHLSQFHSLGFSKEEIKKLRSSDTDNF